MKETITKNITVKIDGKTVKASEGTTVIDAALNAGIYIPSLCCLDAVKSYGGCRLCIIEIENMRGYPTACTTPVAPNMKIKTTTPALQSLRKEILELLLSEHPYTCLICADKNNCSEFMHTTRKVGVTTGCNFCTNNGDCELQELVDYLQLKEVKYPIFYRNIEPVQDNPFYKLDYNLCVLCGRCVRVCNQERNSDVLSFIKRGHASIVGTAFNESQKDAGCEYCGACIDVCPTGSISEKMGRWVGIPDKSTDTVCTYCSVACDMNINTRGNRIINVGPKPGRRSNPPQICIRGKFTPGDLVHHPERITTPLIKKHNKWIETSWEDAISFTTSNLEKYRGNQFGLIGSAQDSMENNYILQKFSRKVMRSNNVDLFSSYSQRDLIKQIHEYYNEYKPLELDAIQQSDTILLVGTNTSCTHPLVENRIRKASKKGIEVILANTHQTRTSNFANKSILYKPGEEGTFLLIILAALLKVKSGKELKKLKESFKTFDIEKAMSGCGILQTELDDIVKSLVKSKKLAIIIGDGILRSSTTVNTFNALYNLQLLMTKPKDTRIMFLVGEGNSYGSGFVGMHPDYLPGFDPAKDKKNIKKWSENWDVSLSDIPGLSGDQMVDNIADDGITSLYVIGDIPPHPHLANLKFLVQQNLFLTETSEFAHVFFPIRSFTESSGHLINLERKIKEIIPVIKPIEQVKAPWVITSEIALLMHEKGFNFKDESDVFKEITSNLDLAFPANKTSKEFLSLKTKISSKNDKLPFKILIEHNYFHYQGNILSKLISDMAEVREESVLNLSMQLAYKLKVEEKDELSITTEFGNCKFSVKIMPDLVGDLAYLKPKWEDISLLINGINLNENFIAAKIERV